MCSHGYLRVATNGSARAREASRGDERGGTHLHLPVCPSSCSTSASSGGILSWLLPAALKAAAAREGGRREA